MTRFSANLGFLWSELPLLDRIDRAAAAGFRAIELHWPYETPPEAVRDACSRHNLTLLAINTPLGRMAGDFGLAAIAGREDEFRAAAGQAFDYCRAAGGSMVHVMAGVVLPEQRDEAERVLVRNLRVAAEEAGDLTLLLEPINQVDKPGYFYSRTADAQRIIEAVDAPNLRLMFDLYHAAHGEDDVLASLGEHYDYIGHIQIAGFPHRNEPDSGERDWTPVLNWLDQRGYGGWVGAEYRPGSVETGFGWKRRWDAGS